MSEAWNRHPGAALHWTDQSDFPLDWNGPTHRPFDPFAAESKARPVIELLERVVRRSPQRIALLGPEGSVTYAELWRVLSGYAEQIAGATAPGDLVAILAPVSPQLPIAMLACLAAGRAFVTLDSNYPSEWIAQVLDDSRPVLLLVSERNPGAAAPAIPAAVRTLNLEKAIRDASPGWRPARLGPDEVACVLFTSGSTGQPQGIVNSQRNLLQRVSQSINAAHLNSDDRFLTLTSLCTIVGLRDLITCLLAGASFYLIDTQNAGAREIHGVIRDFQISILFSFPALLRSVVASSLASAVYRPGTGTYKGQLTVFEPTRRDLGVPSSALLWRRHASVLRHEKLQARHDDMLTGANAQGVADLVTRCLEAAARTHLQGDPRPSVETPRPNNFLANGS